MIYLSGNFLQQILLFLVWLVKKRKKGQKANKQDIVVILCCYFELNVLVIEKSQRQIVKFIKKLEIKMNDKHI